MQGSNKSRNYADNESQAADERKSTDENSEKPIAVDVHHVRSQLPIVK
jgi:hypothetical protein